MEYFLLGFDFEDTPLKIREKFRFNQSQYDEFYRRVKKLKILQESMVLSTCNRTEIYTVFNSENSFTEEPAEEIYNKLLKIIDHIFNRKPGLAEKHFKFTGGQEVLKHLFFVAAGLRSQVLGENQILGQLKKAHQRGIEQETVQKYLDRACCAALSCGKRVRSETELARENLSLSSVAVSYLEDKYELKEMSFLIIGTGKMSRIVLDILTEQGVKQITATNRTHGKVVKIGEQYPEVEPVSYQQLEAAAQRADIIISATSAPHYILEKSALSDADGKKELIDLGVPRDIDPRLQNKENLQLMNLDDLSEIIQYNLKLRQEQIPAARRIITEELDEIKEWLQWQKVVPLIKNISRQNKKIVQKEVAARAQYSELSKKERNEYKEFAGRLSDKLFKRVILNLKNMAAEKEYEIPQDFVQKLFSFPDGD